ncbi:MAG: hypothetical protein K2X43_24965 [Hyphomonadaceae bacterium]|nr:hypothetical protein [Hyphomonadaceae bacterium]
MLRKLGRWASRLNRLSLTVEERLDLVQQALGRIEARQTAQAVLGDFGSAEFKVYSQWGEDGIIEHLLRHVPIANATFIEFGVQDYSESNTRFLLTNRNWSGLVMDGSADNIATIRRDPIYWRHNLKTECTFITRENINDTIKKQGVSGDIGLLSIDIDGNDYWVWQAIDCVSPRIVVAEYNALFGATAAVSVPYEERFERSRAHYSNLYWGCSLPAFAHLGEKKGYALVGGNSAGNNAFFVRRDVLGALSAVTPKAAFRPAKFRESRNEDCSLSYLDPADALKVIGHLNIVNVVTGSSTTIASVADHSSQMPVN